MPITAVETTSRSVTQLLEEASSYWLPAFQRWFEWSADDVIKLLDSVRNKWPIGVIVLWRPSAGLAGTLPFARRLIDSGAPPTYYVLDGQQRLTALLMLAHGWRTNRQGDLVGPIRYDAGRSRFRRGGTVGIDLAVAAQALRNPIGEEARALRSYGESASRTLELVKQVLAYQVPVYRIETDQEDSGTIAEMAKAFIRLNAAGERISNVELLLSLMGGTWAPRIREAIQAGHDLVTDGWDIDLLPYIRLVLHNLGISQSVASHPERFESAVRSLSDAARIDDVALDSARSLDAAGRLLQHELGIPNASLLTSQNVLVPIAAYIRKRSDEVLTATEQTAISHWFLLASLKGRYSGSPDTKLEQDLRIVADASGGFPLEQLVQSMRPADQKILWRDLDRGRRVNGLRREGRPYLLLLWALLAKRGATDWAGRNFTKAPWGTLTRHHIFPQNFLDQEVPEDDPATEWVHSAANITWVNDAINAEIGDTPPSEYIGKEVPLEEARHHFIPLDTPHLLQAEHYEDFLGERMRMIFQATQDEFAPIVG